MQSYSFLKKRLETTPLAAQWALIPLRPYHGINLLLGALRTSKSCGIGEFLDLLPLIHWCSDVGFSVIQLLPINDSGEDPSPYNALSSIALHPIYLSLRALPFIDNVGNTLIDALKKFTPLNITQRIEYGTVLKEKSAWLESYYHAVGHEILSSIPYQNFLKENTWLLDYALYKTLKHLFPNSSWMQWPHHLQKPSKETQKSLFILHEKEISYHCLLQYLCHEQLKQVKKAATETGILLKGDLPILISPDSADVWLQRKYFDLSFSVGYPPDVFNHEGQSWGFPGMHWDAIQQDNYLWWHKRLEASSSYYHLYRLDHVAGFYRLWLIPHGQHPKDGSYRPSDLNLAIQEGYHHLWQITRASTMLPIAEDLGNIPKELSMSLQALGIPGTKIVRWERDWQNDRRFIPYNAYEPLSMTSLSTHDSETLALWWQRHPDEVQDFCAFNDWKYHQPLSYQTRFDILKAAHHTTSLFHINLFQEYLALFPELVHQNLEDERINVPGHILPSNWTYRFLCDLQAIVKHSGFRYDLELILEHKEFKKTLRKLTS